MPVESTVELQVSYLGKLFSMQLFQLVQESDHDRQGVIQIAPCRAFQEISARAAKHASSPRPNVPAKRSQLMKGRTAAKTRNAFRLPCRLQCYGVSSLNFPCNIAAWRGLAKWPRNQYAGCSRTSSVRVSQMMGARQKFPAWLGPQDSRRRLVLDAAPPLSPPKA